MRKKEKKGRRGSTERNHTVSSIFPLRCGKAVWLLDGEGIP